MVDSTSFPNFIRAKSPGHASHHFPLAKKSTAIAIQEHCAIWVVNYCNPRTVVELMRLRLRGLKTSKNEDKENGEGDPELIEIFKPLHIFPSGRHPVICFLWEKNVEPFKCDMSESSLVAMYFITELLRSFPEPANWFEDKDAITSSPSRSLFGPAQEESKGESKPVIVSDQSPSLKANAAETETSSIDHASLIAIPSSSSSGFMHSTSSSTLQSYSIFSLSGISNSMSSNSTNPLPLPLNP
jgi:hypothetical protein